MHTETALPRLQDLHKDSKACAEAIGLHYSQADDPGFTRQPHGKTFRYFDPAEEPVKKSNLKRHIAQLAVPPAWSDVWICPKPNGHILATGVDDRGRKQYIYHPKWRTVRDLIKFYRMIVFGEALPKVRRRINRNLSRNDLSFEHVTSVMIWIMDNSYIRIGSDEYFEENESMGLTTVSGKNAVIAGSTVTFSFKGKSGKDQLLSVDNKHVADTVVRCKESGGSRLFTYTDGRVAKPVVSDDINDYLRQISGEDISAKDFRTWGGTLVAFNHLVERLDSDKKPEKVSIEAVDAAAGILGNTRAVSRSSYVHPHMLETYGSKNFERYYQKAASERKKTLLSKRESSLLQFLKILLEEEFAELTKTT